MKDFEIKAFASMQRSNKTLEESTSRIILCAEFHNNTKTTVTITEVHILVRNFLFFIERINCNMPIFTVNSVSKLNLDLSLFTKNHSDTKKFKITAKDSNGKSYKSKNFYSGLFKLVY
ncbi:MAG: hypothetical protein V4622_07530 [Bacteroidota bacterium]